MILVTQSYTSANEARQRELDEAASINAKSGAFRELIRLDGNEKRRTLGDLVSVARDSFPDDMCVIANSDISFDRTIHDVERIFDRNTTPTIVALTRWEGTSGPLMVGRLDQAAGRFFSHTQDAWVFIPRSVPVFPADFFFGLPGCENRFAFEAGTQGIRIVDPALSICARHHHASGVRGWSQSDSYRGSVLFPQLTTLDCDDAHVVVAIWNGRWHEELIVDATELARGVYNHEAVQRLRNPWRLPSLEFASPLRVRRVTSG